MTNRIPIIKVKSEVKKIANTNPNRRDVICLIGGFEEEIDEPKFYETLTAAEQDLGDDTSIDANAALKEIFHDDSITGVLVVDTTTHSGDTYTRTVGASEIESALNSVAQIDFDLLYVAAELSDAMITKIADARDVRFEDKRPFDYVGVGTRATSGNAYDTTAGKLGDGCVAFLTQELNLNDSDDNLSLVESGAFLTNLIAVTPVGNSLTAKILPEVTGLGTSYTFGSNDLGTKLVGLGYFVVRLVNPMTNTYECVNSAGVNGLDLYINRTLTYIVNEFALRKYLGERNNQATLSGIEMECNRLLQMFRNDLGIVENITYAVEKENSYTVNVILNTVEFADIITEIDVYITIEVI